MLREFIQAQEDGAKAFPYRVELTDAGGPLYSGGAPATYNEYNGGMGGGRIQTPLTQREASLHMQTYGGSEAIDWLMDAVDYVVTAAGSAGYHFEDDSGTKFVTNKLPTDPPETKVAPLTLTNLFKKPNPHMDWADLCEITLIDWLLVGNGYWVKWKMNSSGQPLALYRMCPEYVRVIPGQFGPEEYRYRLPGQRDEITFLPEQVMHFKRTNPHSPYYGLGIVKGGARALDMELALTNTMAHYYENRALPSGVVQTERRVPRDVFRKLKAQLQNFYGGGPRAGMLMVLEAGLKYDAVSPSAADALFQKMGMWSRDRILAMFHLNKGLLGIQDAPGDPKLSDWQVLFDRKTMMPLTQKFASAITRGLVENAWGLQFKIEYEETQSPDQILKRAQTLAPLPGVKVHELRAAAGLPPSTGDKTIDEIVLNLPGTNMDATGAGGPADANLAHEPGRPPIAANTRSFGTAKVPPQRKPAGKPTGSAVVGKKSLDDLDAEFTQILADLDTKALPPAEHVHIGALSGEHVTPPGLSAISDEAQKDLEDAVYVLERSLLDAIEGKAIGSTYQRVKNAPGWKTFEQRLSSILESAAFSAASLANVHRLKAGDSTDVDYESAAHEALQRKNGAADTFMTLKKQVLDKVLAVQRAGSSPSMLDTAIRGGLASWKEEIPSVVLGTADFAYKFTPNVEVS